MTLFYGLTIWRGKIDSEYTLLSFRWRLLNGVSHHD